MHEINRSNTDAGRTRSLTGGALKRILLLTTLVVGLAAVGSAVAGGPKADKVGPITFEPTQGYVLGDINGQQGWMKTGAYDVAVASVSSFPAASGYHFGSQALRLSNSVTSGSFGDQTFSPGLSTPAGEGSAAAHFSARFKIGTALATYQAGLVTSVSPDNGSGGRMSYLRFEDQTDGIHVFFDDVTDNGPIGTVATFNETDIATLSRATAHSVRFEINFKNGPGNDVVKIFIDGKKAITGTTWENYYRYDPEASGSGNQVPMTSKLLFREGGTATAANAGNGFLVDGVTLKSSAGHGQDNGKTKHHNKNDQGNNNGSGGQHHGHDKPGN
jgi:hypothetical protein